jgi:hypothetical protein
MYDPQIGRSFQPDPHEDFYAAKSPFSFLANNPISYTDPTGMDEVEWDDEGGGGGGFDMIGASVASVGGWGSKGGGYTNVSKKWMGVVHDAATNQYFYKGKPVSEGFAKTLMESGRTSFYSPNVTMREKIALYHKSGVNPWVFDGFKFIYTIEPSNAQGDGELTNTYLEGVKFLGTTTNEFTNLGKGASEYCQGTKLFKDWYLSKVHRDRLIAGPTLYVNSGSEKNNSDVWLKCLSYLYIFNTTAQKEDTKWFEESWRNKSLPSDRIFFSYLIGGYSGGNEVHYGSIPASAMPSWWPK